MRMDAKCCEIGATPDNLHLDIEADNIITVYLPAFMQYLKWGDNFLYNYWEDI